MLMLCLRLDVAINLASNGGNNLKKKNATGERKAPFHGENRVLTVNEGERLKYPWCPEPESKA